MKKLAVLLTLLAVMACQLINIQIGVTPTETAVPSTSTASESPTDTPTISPQPTSTATRTTPPTRRSSPTSTPMRSIALVYGMPLDDAFTLLYNEGYSAEMIRSIGEDNTWGVCVYYWENTDYDETHVCLWGGQKSTDPVIEVSLWRFTSTTVGSLDEMALRYYIDVMSALGFDDADIEGIIDKARDLLTLAQQERGEEVYDEYGNYSIATMLETITEWGYTYGRFVIRIQPKYG
jgi:hypothetical protein